MNLRAETEFLLNKYHLKANKNLGQNFLINEEVIEAIVEKAKISENDMVIEIGPGLGSLTAKLVEAANQVVAVELDARMVEVLEERFSLYHNFHLIHADILKVDLHELIERYQKGNPRLTVKVVANLPYYITSPIIMKLLEDKVPVESITVMVQKEVGERLEAQPGKKAYGAITVSVNYYAEPKVIIQVPKENFNPAPEVDSCVVQLKLKDTHMPLADEKLFFRVVKFAFTQRRKNIGNSLTMVGKSKEEIKQMLGELGLDINLRAENLSLEDYARIANYLSGNKYVETNKRK